MHVAIFGNLATPNQKNKVKNVEAEHKFQKGERRVHTTKPYLGL